VITAAAAAGGSVVPFVTADGRLDAARMSALARLAVAGRDVGAVTVAVVVICESEGRLNGFAPITLEYRLELDEDEFSTLLTNDLT
jgi:hypothetical protein